MSYPKGKPRKPYVMRSLSFRAPQAVEKRLTELAVEWQCKRSEVILLLIAEGLLKLDKSNV